MDEPDISLEVCRSLALTDAIEITAPTYTYIHHSLNLLPQVKLLLCTIYMAGTVQ